MQIKVWNATTYFGPHSTRGRSHTSTVGAFKNRCKYFAQLNKNFVACIHFKHCPVEKLATKAFSRLVNKWVTIHNWPESNNLCSTLELATICNLWKWLFNLVILANCHFDLFYGINHLYYYEKTPVCSGVGWYHFKRPDCRTEEKEKLDKSLLLHKHFV